MSVVNNKLACLHVRTMFMFVSFCFAYNKGVMDGSFKQIEQILFALFTQSKSLTNMWRFKTDVLDFQHRHKYKQTMKERDIRCYWRVTMFCSIRDIMFKVRWKVMAGNLQKGSIFVVIYDRNIPERWSWYIYNINLMTNSSENLVSLFFLWGPCWSSF
jgi:hypothetical protein